jgi:predicted kinase
MINILTRLLLSESILTGNKVVTFDGKTYPKNGWSVTVVGGPASGKTTQLNSTIPIDGKIFNIDDISVLWKEHFDKLLEYMSNRGYNKEVEYIRSKFKNNGPNYKKKKDTDMLHRLSNIMSIKKIQEIWNSLSDDDKQKYMDEIFDGNNPNFLGNMDNMGNDKMKLSELYNRLISENKVSKDNRQYFDGTFVRKMNVFYENMKMLPNIIYDVTGRDLERLKDSLEYCKNIGYKTVVIWIITDYRLAKHRNEERERVVPNLIPMHISVYRNMMKILTGKETLPYLDYLWIIYDSEKDDIIKKMSIKRNPNKVVEIKKTSEGSFMADNNTINDIKIHTALKEKYLDNSYKTIYR